MRALLLALIALSGVDLARGNTCCNQCIAYIVQSGQTISFADQRCRSLGCATGICPMGQQTSSVCQQVFCESCPSGTYRNNVNTQASCVPCTTCAAGEVETVACSATINRQCRACGTGNIVVNNQCVQCNSGIDPKTYASSTRTQCLNCDDCSTSQYWSVDCTSGTNRKCETCPVGTMASSINSASCSLCASGYYRQGQSCIVCQTAGSQYPCGSQRYAICSFAAATGGLRSCTNYCDGHSNAASTKCAAGKGVSQICDGTSTVNPSCQTCGPGFDRVDGTFYLEIQRCNKCGTGKFKDVTGTAACSPCSNAGLYGKYFPWDVGTAATSNTCPW
jgi:hypothetical protein